MFTITNVECINNSDKKDWNVEISNDRITIYIVASKNIDIYNFQKHFYPAYAITSHCSQGATFDEPYTIYEYNRMSNDCKYVVLSRARDEKLINTII